MKPPTRYGRRPPPRDDALTKAQHDLLVALRGRPVTQDHIGAARRPHANTGGTGDST